MQKFFRRHPKLSPARRGQIIQRILVEGWSVAEAASTFGLEVARIEAWLADYRRRGMASLQGRGARCRRLFGSLLGPMRAGLSLLDPGPLDVRRLSENYGRMHRHEDRRGVT